MKKILVVWELTKEQKGILEAICPKACFLYRKKEEVSDAELSDADIILGNLPPKRLAAAKNLKWIQLNSAGASEFCTPGVLSEETLLTNASGAYGLAISEHTIGMILMLQKKLNLYYENQKNHLWQDEGTVRGLYGSRVLIVGMGNLGTELAKRLRPFGSSVVGIRRSLREKPDAYEEQYLLEELDEQLSKADLVILCLPGTKETEGLFDESRLARMKETALLVNVGRGSLVDGVALTNALKAGRLAGAALDVTEMEPLPKEHPLWEAPNLLLTPHVSGGYHMKETFELIFEIASENLRRFEAGEPLKNLVNRKAGY